MDGFRFCPNKISIAARAQTRKSPLSACSFDARERGVAIVAMTLSGHFGRNANVVDNAQKDTPQFIRKAASFMRSSRRKDRGKKVLYIITGGANGATSYHYYLPQSYTQAFVQHGSKLKLKGIRKRKRNLKRLK